MDKQKFKIISFLEDRIGIDVEAIGESNLIKMITDRMHQLNIDDLEMYHKILHSSQREYKNLIDLIVVPETWFFRDQASFEFLDYYVSQIFIPQTKGLRPLHLLSLPCSSGEEPYSIVIQLLEKGLHPSRFTVDAIDVSPESIKKALRAVYTKYSFRFLQSQEDKIKKYFVIEEGLYKLKQTVKDCVKFYEGNALDQTSLLHRNYYDVIFCKNLFIYMSVKSQRQLLDNLSALLSPEGILLVSAVEVEYIKKEGFTALPFPRAFAFQKKNKTLLLKCENENSCIDEITIFNQKALKVETPEPEDQLKKAKELADRGLLSEAEALCHQDLNEYGPKAQTYFILALIEHALKNEIESEEYLLKTIYLDPKHYEALIYLALLAEKKGENAQAQLFFNRARRIGQLTSMEGGCGAE